MSSSSSSIATSSAGVTITKIGEPIEMLMNVNLTDSEFNKLLQKQSTKLLAAFGYKLISKFSAHYNLDFEEMCEVAGLKKKKAPASTKIKTEKAKEAKPELTEEEKAAKKAALIARLAEGRAKKAAEKAAEVNSGEALAEKNKNVKAKAPKPELTEEEKAAKKAATAEKRKASLAAKKKAELDALVKSKIAELSGSELSAASGSESE